MKKKSIFVAAFAAAMVAAASVGSAWEIGRAHV